MHVDVAVVGAGPTGLTVANLLGGYGVSTAVIERNGPDDIVGYPRAVGIDHDALRTFQQIGLLDEVLPHIIQNTAAKFFAADRSLLVELDSATGGPPDGGWYRRNMFMQHLTDRALARGLDRYDRVNLLAEHEVVSLRQDANGVTLGVRDIASGGQRHEVTADFVVGADGARSTIRRLVEMPLIGDTYEEPWLILEVTNDPWDEPYSAFFCDPARPVYSGHLPHGHRRWGFMLLPGETDEEMLSEPGLRGLLGPLVPSFDDLDFLRVQVYRHQARQAEHFVSGRVAMVGDSAHLMPPWAGQGLNSGLRDATNLAWKLAAVVRGQASPRLLETYGVEREQHAREVIALSRRFGKVFIPRSRLVAAARDVILKCIRRVPGLRSWFNRTWFSTPLRYDSGLLHRHVGDRDPRVVGGMVIQPDVEDASGTHRLDDVLGPWFAVVSYRCDAWSRMSAESQEFWKSLEARFVRVEPSHGIDSTPADDAVVVEDVHGSLRRWFAAAAADVAVIRPDRIVAAVGTADQLDTITGTLAGQLRDGWATR